MPVKKYFTDDERKAANRAKQWKYIQSDNGKEATAKYNLSIKGKNKTHTVTPARREQMLIFWRKYAKTPKAKAKKNTRTAKSRSRPNGNDLYVMECSRFPGEYKVGRAADPHYRAVQLSAGMPCYFKVSKVYDGHGKCESLVHAALRSFMVKGEKSKSEWFRLPYDELIDKIEDVLIVALF